MRSGVHIYLCWYLYEVNMQERATMTKRKTLISWVALSLIALIGGCATSAPELRQNAPLMLKAKHVQALPVIDGSGNDEAWKAATALNVTLIGVWGPNMGKSLKATIKSVHTGSHVAFLVRWEDATRNDKTHKPWVWNAEKRTYEQGKEEEDSVALAFEHTGPFTADMLSPVNAVWDLWTWKSTRSDPVGYALDKTHRFSTTKPEGKAKEYPSRAGTPIWIQRPDDSGESAPKSLSAPLEYSGDMVSAYAKTEPSGSGADIRAKGKWENGYWTVELLRKLNTGHPDDTAFDPARTYSMAVAAQDGTGSMDRASAVIRLRFERK